jgi:putative MFS transporter
MMSQARPFARLAFWIGCLLVAAGALLHLPMFLMARHMGYVLAGMPMDAGMIWGMALIALGVGLSAYGLLPPGAGPVVRVSVRPSRDAPLTARHFALMAVLAVALVVDVMKPASLGFVLPGMKAEYGLSKAAAAWLPFSALSGTFVGSLAWGVLADAYGRRASILLSTILFVATSICGAMPSFWWNVAMCFAMGAAAGGMLPVVYALLAETMPQRSRGWALVLVGGIGAAGGYLAASLGSAALQPHFGWRILWFLNIPTGLLLVGLSGLIPESPRFLIRMGRLDEARALAARFGAALVDAATPDEAEPAARVPVGVIAGLTLAGLGWSLVNFGILLWLPTELAARSQSIGASSALLARSALLALPASLFAAALYARWSPKRTVIGGLAVTALALAGLGLIDRGAPPVVVIAILIVGSNGLLAVLLPYTAELFATSVRGRATGWVSGATKCGGILAQGLGLAGLIPALGLAGAAICGVLLLAAGLIWRFGADTGRHAADPEPGEGAEVAIAAE